ncbi:argininosuccinate synthase [Tetragenococcus halophilus subsp. halophilus]|uniref:Argininosuccinate synthase n=1 Tax=Tetragenococcus halophilus (strain DSM 20338 / JCM 20259 / NCIMB 9735 / NBRC 12172) TaxID=945021 RepID=A0AAN1VRR5_TETHN|nr:argininosuccinate synthase [Tetragenococcus halophilus]AOF48698.1 argininosuccinate synthase [Tetragenococcus halophilus]NWN99320.1 argininosuccinate synthase [Tetragenococcus halophilus]RQD32640.1 argininosuccinate synthase [Tetragenococcus halophilus subsp. halophilus DSM 20339]BAK94576.1 argininosuccinate synthase [Tetragenococcus halophilus NBRC 12172]GBD59280.1 argininosuccinate synthase [Tetragenococcus halophilus subsp. halophilus]
MKEKVVLAYSGGLDTSVSVRWLTDQGYDVIACCLDIGEGKDIQAIRDKALMVGASQSYAIDAKEEFLQDFALIALQGNTFYENSYPLVSALSRPLIAKKLVELAHKTNATTIAHGCTGKGNDQVRFEVAIASLDPSLKVIAPVRQWQWSREEEIAYAQANNVPIPADLDNPYSIDQNLWGRACECGALEDPWSTPPEGAYGITNELSNTPDKPDSLELAFEKGVPIAINDKKMSLTSITSTLNTLAGKHGIGRIDHVENRLVGIKSREVYECPGALTMMHAHKELEDLVFARELAHTKPMIENQLAQTIYDGLWFNPLTKALVAFIKSSQENVNGVVRLKLFKGNIICEGKKSKNSLYNENLATYTSADTFDQEAAVGFIKLWGLPSKVHAEVQAQQAAEEESK